MKEKEKVFDKSKIEYLRPYGRLYNHMTYVIKEMERQEWVTAAKYCRDALAEMVEQIYQKYSCRPEGMLAIKCQILQEAKIISPQSMANYNIIRECGNAADHMEDQRFRNYSFDKNTLTRVASLLLEETIIFAESYSVDLVEDGQRRIIQANNRMMKGSGNTRGGRQRVYPPVVVRILGIVYLILAVCMLWGIWHYIGIVPLSIRIALSVMALLFGGVGAYGLITGDDWLLLLSLYGG